MGNASSQNDNHPDVNNSDVNNSDVNNLNLEINDQKIDELGYDFVQCNNMGQCFKVNSTYGFMKLIK